MKCTPLLSSLSTREKERAVGNGDHRRRSSSSLSRLAPSLSLSPPHARPSDPPILEITGPARQQSREMSHSLSVTAHIPLVPLHPIKIRQNLFFFFFQSLRQPQRGSESSGSPTRRSSFSTRCASSAARARPTTAGAASPRSRPPSRRPLGPRTWTR